MSSRALRKLQQEKDAKELQLAGSDDEVSIVRPVTGARARRPNPFDLVSFSKNLSNDSNLEKKPLSFLAKFKSLFFSSCQRVN